MRRCQFRAWVILTTVMLLAAACGQADPAFNPGGASFASPTEDATPSATPTRMASLPATATPLGTPVSNQEQNAAWIDLPADFVIRTAAQAEALAVPAAQDMFGVSHAHVANTWLVTQREANIASNSTGGENEDPFALIWWIDLDGAQFHIPSCPAPPPGVTQTSCGTSPIASVRIVASDGGGQGLGLGRRFTPSAESGSAPIPADARLRTEGEAIAAMLLNVRGANGGAPRITSVRLLTVGEWLRERDEQGVDPNVPLAPDAPLWEVSATNAAFTIPCPLQDTSKCVLFNITLAFDALSSDPLMYYGQPATPTAATP